MYIAGNRAEYAEQRLSNVSNESNGGNGLGLKLMTERAYFHIFIYFKFWVNPYYNNY